MSEVGVTVSSTVGETLGTVDMWYILSALMFGFVSECLRRLYLRNNVVRIIMATTEMRNVAKMNFV